MISRTETGTASEAHALHEREEALVGPDACPTMIDGVSIEWMVIPPAQPGDEDYVQ